MATASSLLLPTPSSPLSLRTPSLPRNRLLLLPTRSRPPLVGRCSASLPSSSSSPLHALIFDCDGVILESEHLHRQAYNDAFAHFDVRCPPSSSAPLHWDVHFYDDLQNRIGGGKPKMRWYFTTNGWPSSSIFESPPSDNTDREKLIDIIQDWKTERYKEIIRSGTVEPRPGVLRLMDDAKSAGVLLAVCSAATKSSVILCLESLLGMDRFKSLDCFLAGDDVKEKKPDPLIYLTAAKKLGVSGKNCVVVEDSVIGLQAANGAGMPCIITYTSSTASQDFKDAIATYPDLSNVRRPRVITSEFFHLSLIRLPG
ncbi:putative haloacid dehalogenase-like hydrolase domain-containing protein [Iris pallida]|uniref:Haloacid dehalogenase-like hydrolase domain-containing protein n=1 Tax=Iris pallida TaxID=29817 RepID=A0AAX6ICN2_IRIPA|nr:putative haloacid dehalogenase-like hydrolase domain-containing protein [Iris pallida]